MAERGSYFGGAPHRASQRRASRTPTPLPAAPVVPRDRVTWNEGAHSGLFVKAARTDWQNASTPPPAGGGGCQGPIWRRRDASPYRPRIGLSKNTVAEIVKRGRAIIPAG
jgi:hypothetical protein